MYEKPLDMKQYENFCTVIPPLLLFNAKKKKKKTSKHTKERAIKTWRKGQAAVIQD